MNKILKMELLNRKLLEIYHARLVRVVSHFDLRNRMDIADTVLKASKNPKENHTRRRGAEKKQRFPLYSLDLCS
jgi:hypothetical protein